MSSKTDICFFGEALIDMYTTSVPALATEEVALTANLGGGIFNASVAAARFLTNYPNINVHFFGGISTDFFGERFISLFNHENIVHSHCYRSSLPTALAMVSLDSKGERSFQFFRKGSADISMPRSVLSKEYIQKFSLVALGTNCMVDQHCADFSMQYLEYARSAGIPIAFDPNIRPSLWEDSSQVPVRIQKALQYASIIKIAAEELALIYPGLPADQAIPLIFSSSDQVPWRILFLTKGADGCSVYYNDGTKVDCPAPPVEVVDTTGAGDAFFATASAGLMVHLPHLFNSNAAPTAPTSFNAQERTIVTQVAQEAVNFASLIVKHRGGIGYPYLL